MLHFSLIFFVLQLVLDICSVCSGFLGPMGRGGLFSQLLLFYLHPSRFFSRSSVFKLASCRSQSFSLISQSLHHARRHTHALSHANTPVPAKRSKDKGHKVEAMSRRRRDETWSYRRTDQSPRVFSNAASLIRLQ